MASSSMLFFSLSTIFLFISPSFSSPTQTTTCPSGDSFTAESLIRGLNLFPKGSINRIESNTHLVPGKIVKKKLTFPYNLASSSSGTSVQDLAHHAGYYRLPRSKAARMFYFFFESRNKKEDPVVIWLTGGPGCSSELALFYENGPFQITKNLSLVWNEFGWDKASNILFVDQPIGTGFSYTSDDDDIRHDEAGVSNDLYDFLQYQQVDPIMQRCHKKLWFLYMLEKKISYAIGLGIQGGFMQWSGQVKRSLKQLLLSHFW
ncbi:hypothetical protein AHAS_Ahas08G0084100 [Arachis hypogaea]